MHWVKSHGCSVSGSQLCRVSLALYMWLYVWEQNKRLSGEDKFTALVKLVAENNSSELLEKVTETNRLHADTDATKAGDEEDENYQKEVEAEDECVSDEDSDEEDEDVCYFFDCIFCKSIFRKKCELVDHITECVNK